MVTDLCAQALTIEQQYSVPEWVSHILEAPGFATSYELVGRLNPFCQRADFDGDGKLDFAALVRQRASGKIGIVFVHRSSGRFYVVGAGRRFGNGGDDFEWMDAWVVYDKTGVEGGVEEGPPRTLKGDALLVVQTEAASAIIYWTGTEYRWYQQGD
jgi:hypothetical protein